MTYIGSPIPKLSLGLTFSLSYKNFDFTTYISGVYGRKVFDYGYYFTDFNSPFRSNPSKRMLYEAGKSLPVLDLRDGYSSARSTYYVDDGSYTRLRNIVLGYTFPKKLSSKIGLQTARIYIQGQNLFTWTSYHGLDPEGSVIMCATVMSRSAIMSPVLTTLIGEGIHLPGKLLLERIVNFNRSSHAEKKQIEICALDVSFFEVR